MTLCDYLVWGGGEGRVHQDLKVSISAFMSVCVCIYLYLKKGCFGKSVRTCVRVYTSTCKSQGHTSAVFINSPSGLVSGFLFRGLRLHPALPLSRGWDLGPWSWLSPIALFCSVMPQIGQIGCREHWAQIRLGGEKTYCLHRLGW